MHINCSQLGRCFLPLQLLSSLPRPFIFQELDHIFYIFTVLHVSYSLSPGCPLIPENDQLLLSPKTYSLTTLPSNYDSTSFLTSANLLKRIAYPCSPPLLSYSLQLVLASGPSSLWNFPPVCYELTFLGSCFCHFVLSITSTTILFKKYIF